MKFSFIAIAFMAFAAVACRQNEALGNLPQQSTTTNSDSTGNKGDVMVKKVTRTEEEWKKVLTPDQCFILREKGTERAFTGAYWDNHAKGMYQCAACGTPLFNADAKFESGTGWPSFWEPVSSENVTEKADRSLFMMRTEVLCSVCGGHLGHLFDDGPQPSGLRYCINSGALKFVENRDSSKEKK